MLKLGGYIVGDPRTTDLRIDEALRHKFFDRSQREEEVSGGINQFLKTDFSPEMYLKISRRAAPFRRSNNFADPDHSSWALRALFEDVNPLANASPTVRNSPPCSGVCRVGVSFHTPDQVA